ncbi:GNAT family N-acetyltransferase [Solemya elarraichensis gill symbiont]|uniref:N-acetyltransferase domain-containing protein n=1 Tax=Solemya elarraichensis gill symbiont TaxID=1918949 RepID=A0A1T2KYX5_9GAMM|nr:GNAT family N-acetyltransferase [Solemya elarraichensis gill symbiont]OOZ38068.1 hypothetical protein BOW52_09440 [Solemya elarraichensis gill symbiont]
MNTEITIRQAEPNDAEALVKLFPALYRESDFLLLEHDEFNVSTEEEAKLIEQNRGSKSWVLFVAESENELVGFLGGNGGKTKRNRHTVQIAMAVLEKAQGNGIGRQLLQVFINWASKNHYHRIELTVVETNNKAVSLYQSMGFEPEGIKHNSLKVNGRYINEHYMAKFI